VVETLLEAKASLAAGTQALEGDVGREDVVARSHRGIAGHPIADREARRIRSHGADATDRSGPRRHWKLEQVLSLAAEDLVRVRQNRGRHDVDDHFTGTKDRVGQRLHDKGGAERSQDSSLHVAHAGIPSPGGLLATGSMGQ